MNQILVSNGSRYNKIWNLECSNCGLRTSTSRFMRYKLGRCVTCVDDAFLSKWTNEEFDTGSFCAICFMPLLNWQILNKYRMCLPCYKKQKLIEKDKRAIDSSDIGSVWNYSPEEQQNVEDCRRMWSNDY